MSETNDSNRSQVKHYRTKLLLLHLSHTTRAQMSQNLPCHLFLPFINFSVRSRQFEAFRAQHDPHFIPQAGLSSVPGIIKRVEESRGWVSARFTKLCFGVQGNTEQSGVR